MGIGPVLDIVLIALLVGALLFGMRLNARLKALRAGQEAFAKAVAELDGAAIRAHQSLKELRSNTDETHELLHGRVVAARELIQKLDVASARAEKAARSIETALANQALLQSFAEMSPISPAPISPAPVSPVPVSLSVPKTRTEARMPFDRDVIRADDNDADVPERVLAGLEQIVRGAQAHSPAAPERPVARPSRRVHAADEDLF